MRRRRFLELVGVASVVGPAVAAGSGTPVDEVTSLQLDSTGSILSASERPLTDEDLVAVWAEDSAYNADTDGWNNAVDYGSRPIPVVAVDGRVAGFGSPLVADRLLGGDNLQFYLNVLDALAGGGTVLWDESHDQYWSLDRFSRLEAEAESRGYELRPSWDLVGDLDDADAVVIQPPERDVSARERNALAEFLEDGGAVLVHNQSDYDDYDQGYRLDPVLDRLDAGFRFNDDQVSDYASNAGDPWEVVTTEFNPGFPFFGGDGNEPPTASFTRSSSSLAVGEPLEVDATGSTDPDGSIASYQWRFGDGTTATGETASHSYDTPGDYAVELTVSDDRGATADRTRPVSVQSGGNDRVRATVREVLDGDTVDVELSDGTTESIRVLGVDTPESPSNQEYEREEEWEGIESLDTLGTWGSRATDWARERLAEGDTVELAYDPAEGKRDPFDRLLAYVYYDADGDGAFDALYNEELIRDGQARVYGSGLTRHDDFWRTERDARADGRGIWAESDPSNSAEYRNEPVEELFVPTAAPVRTETGTPPDSRVAVSASPSARVEGGESDSEIPLAAVDEAAGVGVVGGLLVDETYEREEGYDADTATYGNFPFTTNLVDYLADGDGDVLIDGGHGQFASDAALSNEDAAYYQRHLEGVGVGFHQVNGLAETELSGRALLVTPPTEEYDPSERAAIRAFNDDGGAVVFVGSADASAKARERMNDLAADLGSDLRLAPGSVRDASNNLAGDETIPTTDDFEDSLPLFSAYSDGDDDTGGSGGATFTGSLSRSSDAAAHSYATSLDDPEEVAVDLSGASSADFDLYVTLDGRTPTPDDYDRRSWDYGSSERIVVPGKDLSSSTTLGILVDAYSGTGDYELVVEER